MTTIVTHEPSIWRKILAESLIHPGQTIDINESIRVTEEEALLIANTNIGKYLMYHSGFYCMPVWSICFVEHNDNPNAEIKILDDWRVSLASIREIKAMDPITIKYPSLEDNMAQW